MKKTLFWLIACVLLCVGNFLSQSVYALDVMNLPKTTAYVTDYTNTLTETQLSTLNTKASQLESFQSSQIVTVIIPDRQGYELYDIGLKFARDNTIWSKKYNNGLLLIIAKDEKKLRIMVWYGLEWVLPDTKSKEIIDELRPFVEQGNINEAVSLRHHRVEQVLKSEYKQSSLSKKWWTGQTIIFIIFVLIWLWLIYNDKWWRGWWFIPFFLPWWFWWWRWGGSFGWFSGGWGSFGGWGSGD